MAEKQLLGIAPTFGKLGRKDDNQMITDLLKFTIKDQSIDEAMKLMKKQMANNLGDEGCLMSNAFRSVQNPNEIYLLLGWENQESIDKHLKTDHDNAFRKELDPLLAGPPLFFDWELIA